MLLKFGGALAALFDIVWTVTCGASAPAQEWNEP